MILKDKVVIVTGASEGIGRAIAERLSREGAKLALVARREDLLRAQTGVVGGEAFVCDIRDRAQVNRTVKAIFETFGRIDVLINNAGIWQKTAPLTEISDEVIDNVVATNLSGTIYMTKAVLPHLTNQHDETAIVQIVSKSGIVAQAGQSVYTATKYGVKGFTDVLRADLKETKVRIGAVYQSGTDTEMFRKTGDEFDQSKLTKPEDLADAVAYMLTRPPQIWLPEIQVVY